MSGKITEKQIQRAMRWSMRAAFAHLIVKVSMALMVSFRLCPERTDSNLSVS